MGAPFETPSIGLAAFLACRGHKYRVRWEVPEAKQGRVLFLFQDTSPADTLAYRRGALVPAEDYYRELKQAREAVWWLQRDRRS